MVMYAGVSILRADGLSDHATNDEDGLDSRICVVHRFVPLLGGEEQSPE